MSRKKRIYPVYRFKVESRLIRLLKITPENDVLSIEFEYRSQALKEPDWIYIITGSEFQESMDTVVAKYKVLPKKIFTSAFREARNFAQKLHDKSNSTSLVGTKKAFVDLIIEIIKL